MLKEHLDVIVGSANHTLPTDLRKLRSLSRVEMKSFGLHPTQILKLESALTLACAIAEPAVEYGRLRITSPEKALEFCKETFKELALYGTQEEFWVITLDTKNQVIDKYRVTVGTLRNSLVHPREVFYYAVRDSANCIIVLHNHPSGDPTPSDQDITVTERLEKAAEVMGIPLVDHIIVGREKCISLHQYRNGGNW